MIIREWVSFGSDLPNDMIEEEGVILKFPGKNVAEVLQELLSKLGCESEEIVNLEHAGWEFGFKATEKRRRIWCRVTMIDEYLVGFWQGGLFRGSWRNAYADVLMQLAGLMDADPRFQKVRWFAEHEVLVEGIEGAARPVERSL